MNSLKLTFGGHLLISRFGDRAPGLLGHLPDQMTSNFLSGIHKCSIFQTHLCNLVSMKCRKKSEQYQRTCCVDLPIGK